MRIPAEVGEGYMGSTSDKKEYISKRRPGNAARLIGTICSKENSTTVNNQFKLRIGRVHVYTPNIYISYS